MNPCNKSSSACNCLKLTKNNIINVDSSYHLFHEYKFNVDTTTNSCCVYLDIRCMIVTKA